MSGRRDSALGSDCERTSRGGAGEPTTRRIVFAGVLALVLIGSAAAVALSALPSRAAPPFRTLRIGEAGMQIVTFNPMLITLTDEFVVVYNVYSTLVTWNKSSGSMPDLAYSWSLAADNVTWTFHLVHNAYFVDPTNPGDRSHPVTSADVVYTYNLQKNLTGSGFYPYVTEIRGLSAPDPFTVQIITYRPSAVMYATLATVPILPQYVWSTVPNPLRYSPKFPIGSGPVYYDTTNSTLGSLVIFRRSPSYYGPAYYCRQVRPDEIRYFNYASSALMVNDFLAGTSSLDAIEGIDPAAYLTSLGSWSPRWGVDEGFVGEFSVNVMTPAIRAAYAQFRNGQNNLVLLNQTVRTAIAMSINKTALLRDALLGLGNLADSLVPDSNPWHYPIPPSELFKFNTTAARALLNAAGWAYDSTGALNPGATPLYQKGASNNTVYWPLTFRFYTLNTAPEWQVAAIDINGWLSQAGIQTTTITGTPGYSLLSVNQMSTAWLQGNYDLWFWDWVFGPHSDPSLDILEVETTMAIGPTSDNFYSNSTYDGLYNESLVTLDPVARRNLTNTMQEMIYRYASYILPYYRFNLFAALDPSSPSIGSQARWTDWGNWSRDAELAPDSSLPDLWFQVEPVDNRAPMIQSFPVAQGQNGTATPIAVNASDPDGNNLTYTWTFGDGSAPVVTTTGTVTHTYATPGNYTLGVVVSDGEWLACANSTAQILPYNPLLNQPPSLGALQASFPFSFPNGTRFQLVNRPVGFQLLVQDSEGDPVYLKWFWGDGSNSSQLITGTSAPQTVLESHAYAAVGNYTLSLVGTDNRTGVGNHVVTENMTGVLVLSDTAPPVTAATLAGTLGQNGWYVSSVQVTLAAVDDLTGVASTSYSVDGGTSVPYTAPFTVSGDGTHSVTYGSTDRAGNVEPPKSTTVSIDTTGPTTTASLSGTLGAAAWYTTPVVVTLTATDTASPVASTQYSVDGGAWTAYAAAFSVTGDGNHTARFYSVNAAGITGATTSQAFRIDTTPPTASASQSGTAGSNGWYISLVTVTLAAADATSGVGSIEYSVNGSAWTAFSAPLVLADGTYTILYRATDVAGNSGAVQSLTVKVDRLPPTLSTLNVPGRLTSSSVTVTWTGIDLGSGIASYAVSVDGGPFRDIGTTPSVVLSLSDGTHTITIRATDAAGNMANQSSTVIVDTNILSFTGPYGVAPAIALVVIVAAVLAAVALLWRRRKRASPAPEDPPAPPP